MESSAVLPLRFGSTLDDGVELRMLLRREGAHFGELLDRVRGCVELAVRVEAGGAQLAPPGDGAQYMRARLEARRRQGTVLEPLAQLAKAMSSKDGPVASASYLLDRVGVDGFVEEVIRLQARNRELSISCTGPWAPYSFVEASAR
jgi:hypothetical protein